MVGIGVEIPAVEGDGEGAVVEGPVAVGGAEGHEAVEGGVGVAEERDARGGEFAQEMLSKGAVEALELEEFSVAEAFAVGEVGEDLGAVVGEAEGAGVLLDNGEVLGEVGLFDAGAGLFAGAGVVVGEEDGGG